MGEKNAHILLDCLQQIPCNPCVTACPAGAISKDALTALPRLNEEKCTGCRLCVAACPGQAIFYQRQLPGGAAEVTFAYEYLPLPRQGDIVTAVDAEGQPLGPAQVAEVRQLAAYNSTPLVTIRMEGGQAQAPRGIRRVKEDQHG